MSCLSVAAQRDHIGARLLLNSTMPILHRQTCEPKENHFE